jgi:pimeloyl-ACP methyl ester carboxylesterase
MTAAGKTAPCVILVPGLGRRRTSLRKLEKALTHAGYGAVGWSYPNLAVDVTQAANRLHEVVELNLGDGGQVHFVTHSLGGIVVRRMLKLHPLAGVGGIVMLAPPNRGSALARFLLARTPFAKRVVPLPEVADAEVLTRSGAGGRLDPPRTVPSAVIIAEPGEAGATDDPRRLGRASR